MVWVKNLGAIMIKPTSELYLEKMVENTRFEDVFDVV